MKNLFYLIAFVVFIACSASKKNIRTVEKLEIIQIDTTTDFFVFKTKNDTSKEVIVLAERDRMNDCRPFKKFIIEDSVHQTSVLKSGSHKIIAGFYLSTIDGVKIKHPGELPKIIWNCNCFTDK